MHMTPMPCVTSRCGMFVCVCVGMDIDAGIDSDRDIDKDIDMDIDRYGHRDRQK